MGWAVATVLLLGVAWAAYLAITGYAADRHVHTAQARLAVLRSDLTSTDADAAQLASDQSMLQSASASAAHDTSGPLWAAAAHFPLLGRSVRSAQGATSVIAHLSVQAVPGIVDLRQQLLQDRSGHGFPVAALQQAARPLSRADASLTSATAVARQLPTNTGIGSLDASVRRLQSQLGALSGQLSSATRVANIAPRMLGADGTRNYFVAFENEAETRGVGGLPGAFAIVTARNGQLSFTHFGSDLELASAKASVPLPADYVAQYGEYDPSGEYVNSDVSPDFPIAARIWMGMWEQVSGQRLDGAVVLDPTALAALLQVTGPASLPDHSQVTSANVVALTERDAYTRFGSNDTARKQFLLTIARAASDQVVTAGPAHPTQLATALARMAGQRRLLLYSAQPTEEAVLATEPIAGLLAPTTGPQAVAGPYLMVDLVNGAGNKVDYYIHEHVSWTAGGCTAASRANTVTVTLTNDAPPGLPGIAGYLLNRAPGDHSPLGTDRLLVTVRPAGGSSLTAVDLDGQPTSVSAYTEQGRPAYSTEYEIEPGQTRTLVLHLLEPTKTGRPVMVAQPLVVPEQTSVHVPAC